MVSRTDHEMSAIARRDESVDRLARGLGWLSVGLGTVALAAPGAVCRLGGIEDSPDARTAVRMAGVREWGHGAGLLRGQRPTRWLWSRVLGDAMDLAMLTEAFLGGRGEKRPRAAIATVAGLTAVDLVSAVWAGRRARARRRMIGVYAAITVNRPVNEVYRFWRDLENLPCFMTHLVAVQGTGAGRFRWTAKAPAGRRIEWDAEIVEDRPNQSIAWRSLPGTKVPNSGRVRFSPAPGGRGTEIRVELGYAPPAGSLGRAVAKLFGEEPDQQVRDDLRRFKQVIETGDVVRSDGSPNGTSARDQVLQRPAQPLATTLVR